MKTIKKFNGKIVYCYENDLCWILSFYVDKMFRRKYNGTKLMNYFLKKNKCKIFLVADKREEGQCWRFYKKFGFKTVKRTKIGPIMMLENSNVK